MGRPGEKRNYRKEYDSYHKKPAQKKKRATRNAANTTMKKAGLIKKGDGKGVDHKTPLRSGGSNKKSNLRVVKKAVNRAWRKGKKGYG